MGPALLAMFSSTIHHSFVQQGISSEEVAEKGKNWREAMAKIIRSSDKEIFIISAELLVSSSEADITALRDFLQPLCDEILVIGYVRPPKVSIVRHKDVGAGVDYRTKFEKFDLVFGRENVNLRKFDPGSFPNNCIVTDFCDQLGIEDRPEASPMRRVNESLTREACCILYAYRKLGAGYGVGKHVIKENQKIIDVLRAMSGEKLHLSAPLVCLLGNGKIEDLHWMEERLGTSLLEENDENTITREADLLRVSRSSCEEFASKFQEIYGMGIPAAVIPVDDPAAPQDVADLVEHARGIVRHLAEKAHLAVWDGVATSPVRRTSASSRPVKRCIIHIGMPKTGSSSIQRNLSKFENTSEWRFLKVGGSSNMGPALLSMFSSTIHHTFEKQGIIREKVATKGKKWREAVERIIRESDDETFIISAELLVFVPEADLTALRDFLQPLCDEILVIGYVRPPIGYSNSIFQQEVKKDKIRDLSNVGKSIGYRKKFEKFDRVFGRRNVNLVKFDPGSFPNHCVVTDFCDQLGLRDRPEPSSIRRVNESLSREACGILYAYRKLGPGYGVGKDVLKENSKIILALLAMRGEKFRLSPSLVAPAVATAIKDLKWMEKRLGASLQEVVVNQKNDISCEEDLLRISRASCQDFVRHFENIHKLKVPEAAIPDTDPVAPQDVANLVECSRKLIREELRNERRKVSSLLQKLRKFPKWMFRRLFRQPT